LNFKTKLNMAVNKVILVGNVGKDPETRYLDENTPVCKFPLATSETYKNRDGERIEQTEWHNIVLWRGLAKVAEQYVKKGSQLYIEGRIRTRSYDDKDGIKRYTTEIVGDNMQMLGRRQDGDQRDDGYGPGRTEGSGRTESSGSYGSTGASGTGTSGGTGSGSPGTSGGPGSGSPGSGGTGPGGSTGVQQGGPAKQGGDRHSSVSHDPGKDDPDIGGAGEETDDLPF
jgi:single-strand DNA-binding protein